MTIGLFAPLPLAIMIPFMAGQSFAMGEAFGRGFQWGKRRVSSMTNEEFNKTSAQSMFQDTTADIKSMIPAMKDSMSEFSTLQIDVIKELIKNLKDILAEAPTIVQEFLGIGGGSQGTSSGGSSLANPAFSASLANPAGIAALMKLWAREGAISFETLETFEKQTAAAVANLPIREGAGAVTQIEKANRLAKEARDRRARAELINRQERFDREKELKRQSTVAVTNKRLAGRSQIAERKKLIRQISTDAKQVQNLRSRLNRQFDSKTSMWLKLANQSLSKNQSSLTRLLSRYRF